MSIIIIHKNNNPFNGEVRDVELENQKGQVCFDQEGTHGGWSRIILPDAGLIFTIQTLIFVAVEKGMSIEGIKAIINNIVPVAKPTDNADIQQS